MITDTEKGLPGMGSLTSYVDTRQAFTGLSAGENLDYGILAKITGNQALPPSAATDKIAGMVRRPNPTIKVRYDLNDLCELIPLSGNQLILLAEGAIADGSDIFVRHTADGAKTQLGIVAGAAGTGLVKVPGLTALGTSYSINGMTAVRVAHTVALA